ncbi:MAG: CehA/McbA family metallohydrolase [Deltaproteobacteria bacterium]|nr:CehA/McbA family metallohydrolase [Deltaproteobacteria bacterium]
MSRPPGDRLRAAEWRTPSGAHDSRLSTHDSGLAAMALLLLVSCSTAETSTNARAYRMDSRVQGVGGPGAVADEGDFVLDNGVVRVAILRDGNSPGPGMFGGSLVDADRVRSDGTHRAGKGMDAFAELMPMVNLMVPGYRDDPAQRSHYTTLSVEVLADEGRFACPGGTCTCATSLAASTAAARAAGECPVEGGEPGCSAILACGKADRLVEALGMIETLGVRMNLSIETTYLLDPGADYVRIRTDVFIDNRWVDSATPYALGGVEDFIRDGLGVLDVLTGDELLPPTEPHVWRQGFLAGDFLLMGKKVRIFAAGHGFDFPDTFQRLFDEGKDILGTPQAADAVVGVGDGVSYAYGSEDGPTIVPIYTGEFTGAFTNGMRCANDDTACVAHETQPLRYERILAIGRGDVASALAAMYRLRGEATGTLAGHVHDRRTGRALPGAEVFVLRDPWASDATHEFPATAERLLELLVEELGNPGVVTELGADLADDAVPDGSFSGPVPPGSYFLVVRVEGRALSAPVRVRVAAGGRTDASLAAGPPGRVDVEVFDETGSRSPAKLTFVGPIAAGDPCGSGAAVAHLTAQSAARPLALGGGEIGDRIAAIDFTVDGAHSTELEPGRYDLWISRGFEYSVHRQCLDVPAYDAARVVGVVRRQVRTTGWVSGDFHTHGENSYDADMPYDLRVRSAIAEGVDVVAATDHDVVTDLGAQVEAMGLRHRIVTATGDEVTPIETGHIIGFPLRYDARAPQGGAIDWTRRDFCVEHPDAPDCNHDGEAGYVLPLRPGEVFAKLRELGQYGPQDTLVIVPHPRDGFFGLFDQFGLNHFDASWNSPGLIRGQHPLLRAAYFSWDFDALELLNSKRFEMIRTPTVSEISDFTHDLALLQEERRPEREIADLHRMYQGLVLARTAEEAAALRYGATAQCLRDEHCGAGEMCDLQRQACAPAGARCTGHGDCADGQACLFETSPSRCAAACTSDADCRLDSRCDATTDPPHARCVRRTCAPAEAPDFPCVQSGSPVRAGPVDDWFRLLEHGIVKTGLGNSDSHSITSLETGCARNFVYVGSDDPAAVDIRDVVRAIKAGRVVASYGPFVELLVDGHRIGDTVSLGAGGGSVHVEASVQWATWFDVDRVEIYRSGELLRTIEPTASQRSQGRAELSFDDEVPGGRDAWYVAIAMGAGPDARSLAPVYTPNRHPYLGFTQVVATTFASIDDPLIHAVLSMPLPVPEEVDMLPYAITNPVFVDADGTAGFQGPAGQAPAVRWAPTEEEP